jgi:hypothetical protein
MLIRFGRVPSFLLLTVTLALGLGGCASGATAQGMAVKMGEVKPAAPEVASSIEIHDVTGGRETDPAAQSEVSNEAFKNALLASLKTAGLLAESNASRFKVRVSILGLRQPMVALDMTVTATVRYVIIDTKSGAQLLDEVISTPYTARIGDAFIGVTRLRLANEGAARKNIAGFIEKVNTTKLGQPGAGAEITAAR